MLKVKRRPLSIIRLHKFFAVYTTKINPKADCSLLADFISYIDKNKNKDLKK